MILCLCNHLLLGTSCMFGDTCNIHSYIMGKRDMSKPNKVETCLRHVLAQKRRTCLRHVSAEKDETCLRHVSAEKDETCLRHISPIKDETCLRHVSAKKEMKHVSDMSQPQKDETCLSHVSAKKDEPSTTVHCLVVECTTISAWEMNHVPAGNKI